MIPTIFGFPLWRGKIKNRIAKKRLTRWHQGWMLRSELADLGVGAIINDCSGQNGRVLELSPEYRTVGRRGGEILSDVIIVTDGIGGCSLCNCGIEPQLSQEVIEKRMVEHARGWTLGVGGKTWYGDSPKYPAIIEQANLIISTVESGGHITDHNGRLLEQYKTH